MVVEKITQRGGRVTVTAGGRDFTADACICTVPARVLTKITFDPPLPAAHAAAANKLQYARIVKNQILFKERFWGPEDFSLVSDVTSALLFSQHQKSAGQTRDTLQLCDRRKSRRARLTKQSAGAATSSPRDLLPLNRKAPELAVNIQSMAWQRDAYTQGAYAFYRPGQWFTLRPILQQPHWKGSVCRRAPC